jgi:hypothetical protein
MLTLAEEIDDSKALYSPKKRKVLAVVSCFLSLCTLLALVMSQINSVKIVAIYILTAGMMYLIILYKNFLNKYEIGIFCFLCIQLVSLAPKFGDMDSLTATSYLLSYRYGVSSRSFVATVIDILTNGSFVSKYFVWHFIFCSLVFLSFLISTCLGYNIQKNKGQIKLFVLFLSLLYLTSFTSPSAYFTPVNFGRLEIFALIIMLFLVVIVGKPGLRWIIPLLALFALTIHLILVFFYIPLVCIILLYELLGKENRPKGTVMLLAITIIIIVVSFFAYLLFHEQTFVFHNALEFSEYLKNKTDLVFTENFLHLTLFAKLQDHLDDWRKTVSLKSGGNISILINFPLLLFFIVFWIKCFLQESKKEMKLFFVLPILALIYQALAFLMFYDFGRWMIMILNVQFILTLYLVYVRNEIVLSAARAFTSCINKHWFIIILVCFLMIFLGPVKQIGPSDRIVRILKGVVLLLK